MFRNLIIFLFLVAICCFLPAPAGAEELVEVDQFQWTDSVNPATRQYNLKYGSSLKGREAYLWMRLKGSPELLEKLRASEKGEIPIHHAWFRYEADRIRPDVDIALSMGRKQDLHKLSYQVDAEGCFYWRVWSKKSNLKKGWWRVDVLDEHGDLLQYTENGVKKPCSFKIEVR